MAFSTPDLSVPRIHVCRLGNFPRICCRVSISLFIFVTCIENCIIYRVMVSYRLSKTWYLDFFVVLHHLFRITSHFFPYYLILMVLFSPFFRISWSFWYYFHTFGRVTTLFCYYKLFYGVLQSPFHCVIVDSCKPRITLSWIPNIVNLTYSQTSARLMKKTPCQNISLCLKLCILQCTDELSCDTNLSFSQFMLALIVYVPWRGYIGYLH